MIEVKVISKEDDDVDEILSLICLHLNDNEM